MFQPYSYAPRQAYRGRTASQPGLSQPMQPAETAAQMEVPLSFRITDLPTSDWGVRQTKDYFIAFPPDSVIQELALSWSAAANTFPYSAQLQCELMQRGRDGLVRSVVRQTILFQSARTETVVQVDSGLTVARALPLLLRVSTSSSGSAEASSEYPSGPWWNTSGLELYGTAFALLSEVS